MFAHPEFFPTSFFNGVLTTSEFSVRTDPSLSGRQFQPVPAHRRGARGQHQSCGNAIHIGETYDRKDQP